MASCVSETRMCVYVPGFLSFQNVKSTGRFYIFFKNSQFHFFYELNENSTRQTGRVIHDLHSPDRLHTRIDEWASAK